MSAVPRPALGARLVSLTALRLSILTLLLALTGVLHLRYLDGSYSGQLVLAVLAFAFASSAVQAALLRRDRHLRAITYAQILTDQLTWTVLAYVTGGVASGITSFYGLTCLIGAVLDGVRGVVAAAVIAVCFLSLMCVGFVTGWLEPPPDQVGILYLHTWKDLSLPFSQSVLALTLAALLAGYLAERLQRAGGQLQEAQARAAQAEHLALLGRFAAGLAHEIRNPLGAIAGSAEILAMTPSLTEEDRVLCSIISRETARLNDLVTDMLELARPHLPEKAPVDVAALASEVVRLSAQSGRGADVDVEFEGPSTPLIVEADAAQLRQVLWNLVRNAIQASSPNSAVTVRVRLDPRGPLLEVQDQGQGIGEATRTHLFDAFFTTRTHGVGIGLAVVKRIVEDHGWSIEVDSTEGKGATFRILATLPPSP